MLDQLLDPRSVDAFIDAMGQPAVRDIAVGTLKKLGAIRERIDETFNALRDVEGASEREEARMATVIDLLGIGRPSVEILIEYLDGPFSRLQNCWTFRPTGENTCEVEFFIDYEFRSRTLAMLMGAMFDAAFHKFSTAFEKRADQVYARKSP